MQDIIERLDRELSAAPATGVDIGLSVAAGRRALRRRRITTGAGVLAAFVVIGGAAALVVGGDDPRTGQDVTQQPPTSPTATATTTDPADGVVPVDVHLDGSVEPAPGAQVLERAQFTASGGQVAEVFHLRLDGREYYAYGETADNSVGWAPLPVEGLSLDEWAEQQLTRGDASATGDRSWVSFDDRSRLHPKAGVEIGEQRADPGFGERFAAPGEFTAAAEVRRSDATWFLAVRQTPDGATEAIPYRKDDRITTLDAFISYARDQYATNDQGGSEGLR